MSTTTATLLVATVLASLRFDVCGGIVIKAGQVPEMPDMATVTAAPATADVVTAAPAAVTAAVPPAAAAPSRTWPVVTAQKNLCVKGRIVPELILLGAYRAATASFGAMLECPWTAWAKQEPKQLEDEHLWDDDENRFSHGRSCFTSGFPDCDNSKRIIAVDAWRGYMLTDTAPKAAPRLAGYYGEQAALIKFGVILRNPLERVQSAFHHFVKLGWYSGDTSQGFRSYVLKYITNSSRDPANDPCELVKNANYTAQLRAYFGTFSHSQFTVVPFQDLVQPKKSSAAIFSLWGSLGLNVTDATSAPDPVHLNENAHPALAQELEKAPREKAKEVIEGSMRVQALAALLQDVVLPTFTGGAKTYPNILAWLRSRW